MIARYGGKLSLQAGTPMHMPCHNDLNKKSCDKCTDCFDPHCNGSNCDAHGDCMCQRTQCICLGRLN